MIQLHGTLILCLGNMYPKGAAYVVLVFLSFMIVFFFIVVAICDLVHDLEAIFHLY